MRSYSRRKIVYVNSIFTGNGWHKSNRTCCDLFYFTNDNRPSFLTNNSGIIIKSVAYFGLIEVWKIYDPKYSRYYPRQLWLMRPGGLNLNNNENDTAVCLHVKSSNFSAKRIVLPVNKRSVGINKKKKKTVSNDTRRACAPQSGGGRPSVKQ